MECVALSYSQFGNDFTYELKDSAAYIFKFHLQIPYKVFGGIKEVLSILPGEARMAV